MQADGVFEGCGVKLPAISGAISAVTDRGFAFHRLAGTSAGAIVAAAMAAGYTADEIKDLVFSVDFRRFTDGSKWRIKQAYDLWRHLGINKGDTFYRYMRKLLYARGVRTFEDVWLEDEDYSRLKIIVTDAWDESIMTLPDDAENLGIKPKEMEVALAVRMSISIPFFFRPVKVGTHRICDGGVVSNYPVWLFDTKDRPPKFPTFGVLLDEEIRKHDRLNSVMGFGKAILRIMMKSYDINWVHEDDRLHRTIGVPVGDVDAVDFNIKDNVKQMLWDSGYDAAEKFLDGWDWDKYLAWAMRVRNIPAPAKRRVFRRK